MIRTYTYCSIPLIGRKKLPWRTGASMSAEYNLNVSQLIPTIRDMWRLLVLFHTFWIIRTIYRQIREYLYGNPLITAKPGMNLICTVLPILIMLFIT